MPGPAARRALLALVALVLVAQALILAVAGTGDDGRAIGDRSGDWLVTSGSLRAGDSGHDGATSSPVFRAVSVHDDVEDARVSMRIRADRFVTTGRTPERDFDGVHVLLRYQSPRELYSASVQRRDGEVVVKKKLPGGPSHGGLYTTLAQADVPSPLGRWRDVRVSIRTVGGEVHITVALDGRTVLRAVDAGAGGPPILAAGRVGLRGDNCEFEFDGVRVEAGERELRLDP